MRIVHRNERGRAKVMKNLKIIFIAGCFLISSFSLAAAVEKTEVYGKTEMPGGAENAGGKQASGKTETPNTEKETSDKAEAVEQIVLSGKVIFDEYRGGEITISVNTEGTSYESKQFKILNSVVLEEPGFFFISVPMHSGKVFLEAYSARNTPDGLEYLAWGKYSSNPLMADTENIGDLNIRISDISINNKMSGYQGETVAIKGRVIFDKYRSGPIFINASSAKGAQSNINSVSIDSPGEYVMEVPVDTGTVYITAVNSDQEVRQSQKAIGGYGNPLTVGSADIEGIDISLYEDVSSEIDQLPTVTIRGRISVNGFNGEVIHVGVGKVDYERPNINFTDLSAPGEYVLKVPKNSGPVYVTSGSGERFKSYKNNPVLVKDADIAGIDIDL
jgi:hypothetical protein